MYQARALPLNYVPSPSLGLGSYLSDYNDVCSFCCVCNFPVDHANIAWVLLEALGCARYVLNEDCIIRLSWSLGGTSRAPSKDCSFSSLSRFCRSFQGCLEPGPVPPTVLPCLAQVPSCCFLLVKKSGCTLVINVGLEKSPEFPLFL